MKKKITTTDRKELQKNKDLIYLPSYIGHGLDFKIKQCKECYTEIKEGMNPTFTSQGYCSEWCRDESPILIKKMINMKDHICTYTDCINKCRPILRTVNRNGNEYKTLNGMYSKCCEEHKGLRNPRPKKEKIVVRKIRSHTYKNTDLKGHTCYTCKVYKNWNLFPNNKCSKNGKAYLCKDCGSLKHKEYYQLKKLREKQIKN